jgi:metallopeptidase MepB
MSLPQPLPLIPAAEDIVPAMRRIVDDHNAARLQILETVNPDIATFENVMGPLAQVENSVQGAFAMIDMLQYGSPSLATHEAFDNAREIYAEAEAAWKSDKSFFELLQAAREKDNFHKLDGESRHLMERELLKYKRAGHGLIGDTLLQEYQKRYSEILELELEFQQNVARENGGLWFTLNELEGIPKSELEKWKDERDGEDKVNSSRKKKFVPFTNGGTLAVLTYAHRPETRKRMFLADNLKLERNKPLFEKIVANRAKQAHLLNYSSHAAFRVEERMIKTTTRLKEFLSHVQNTLCPRGKAEIEVLQRRRFEDLRARGHDGAEQLEQGFPPWEKRYYERLVEQGFKIDQLKIAEFFPLEQTTASMLNVFASLFGLRFDPVTDDLLTEDVIWHDSVRAFSVWDSRDSEFIGYLYFDLLWREYKFRGNHDVNIQCVSQPFLFYSSFPVPNSSLLLYCT